MKPDAVVAERRLAPRMPVIKSAKLTIGGSDGIYNCLVLDESATGVLVDLGAVFEVPAETTLQMTGGASYRVRRCWAVGTKAGLEFVGKQIVSAEAGAEMARIVALLETRGLEAALGALRASQFFGQQALRHAAEEAEAAYYRLEAMLKGH